MKTESVYFIELDKEISYLIGQNAKDNDTVINEGDANDIWFHAKSVSSSHVVCILPDDLVLDEKEKKMLIRKGAELCKAATNKLAALHKVPIIYTEIKNITKTKTHGLVNTKNTKTIVI
jgi:predicted ribosome quality control (RQC) complex YloA/Tae2 family protein